MASLTRRQLLAATTGLTLAGPAIAEPARAALSIKPRSSWGADLPPKGPLDAEDVKFLIVHHSASSNGHSSDDVPGILRNWYKYHTGPEKGWNDVAYNFVIDSDGGIWEARRGSLDGPVAGDATGGNQGFTQLVCIIGDYNTAQPRQASLSSLVQLLAWLADRYGVSTADGAEVTFTSRGSNRWPEGTSVTTPTITGHRSMSKTACPGDNLNSYVIGTLTADVETVRNGGYPASSNTSTTEAETTTTTKQTTTTTRPTTSTSSTTTASSTTTSAKSTTTVPTSSATGPAAAPASTTSSSTAPPSTAAPTTPAQSTPVEPLAVSDVNSGAWNPLVIGSGALVALGSGLLVWRYNRLKR